METSTSEQEIRQKIESLKAEIDFEYERNKKQEDHTIYEIDNGCNCTSPTQASK